MDAKATRAVGIMCLIGALGSFIALSAAWGAQGNTQPSQSDQDFSDIGNYSNSTAMPAGMDMQSALSTLSKASAGDNGGGSSDASGLLNAVGKMQGGGSAPAAPANGAKSPWLEPTTLKGFGFSLLVKFVVMTIVIWAAFEYKEFPVIWRDAAAVAFGVSLFDQLLVSLFSRGSIGGILLMLQADQFLAAFILLWLITTFTEAKEFPTASGITVTVIFVNAVISNALIFFI